MKRGARGASRSARRISVMAVLSTASPTVTSGRSEEHTSELQSLRHLVCRLLLEKKKKQIDSRRSGRGPTAGSRVRARRGSAYASIMSKTVATLSVACQRPHKTQAEPPETQYVV